MRAASLKFFVRPTRALAACGLLLFAGCLQPDTSLAPPPQQHGNSDPVVKIRMGVAGVTALGKRATIKLRRFDIVFTSSVLDTVRDSVTATTTPSLDSSTSSSQIIEKSYALAPQRSWKMLAISRDAEDSVIHKDSAFIPALYAGDTALVSLSFAPRFAVYQAQFFSLPDSIASSVPSQPKQELNINRLVLKIDGVIVRDSTAVPGPYFAPGVPHMLAFDYVGAATGTWTSVGSGTGKNLNAIQFPTPDTGYVLGDTVALKTVDGGRTWSAMSGASPRSMRSISFLNGSQGLIGGDSATGGRTSNGGIGWTVQKISNFAAAPAMVSLVNDTGFSVVNAATPASNTSYRRTTNGGATWSPVATYANNIHGLYCLGASACWAVGYNGTIRKNDTTDSQRQFYFALTSGTTKTLRGVFFSNPNVGWTVGDTGTILKTTNGGSTWGAQSSGTVQNLRAVHFLDTTLGYAVGDNGVILATTNGGASWATQSSGTSRHLRGVGFSGATGFAVGDGGTILKLTDVRQMEMLAYGPFGTSWDITQPLYRGTRYVNVLGGSDAAVSLVLRWAGPTTGSGSLNAAIGKAGTVVVNGYVPPGNLPKASATRR